MTHFRDLTLYLVRHGQTEDNVAGRWTGRNDSHLTARGRVHARDSGALLRALEVEVARLDFVASPLHRACVTMELLREGAGLDALGYRTDRRLMENDCGDFSSLSIGDIRQSHAEHHDRLAADEWNWRAPGGMTQAEQYDHVGEFLRTLKCDTVLASHGLTIRLLRAHILGQTPDQALAQPFHDHGLLRYANGSETCFPVE